MYKWTYLVSNFLGVTKQASNNKRRADYTIDEAKYRRNNSGKNRRGQLNNKNNKFWEKEVKNNRKDWISIESQSKLDVIMFLASKTDLNKLQDKIFDIKKTL